MTEANQKEPKPNVAGGRRGGGQSAGVEGSEATLSVCLSALGLQPSPVLKLCSMDGGMNRQAARQGSRRRMDSSSPPLPLSFSSSALWSWMELNANDLTELKSYKNLFLFFCWLVPIVLSLLCLLMPFYVLYFSAYYLFGITYSLTYYKSSLFFS